MTRFALGIEYDGSAFHGWQRLSKADQRDEGPVNVQRVLEKALSRVADEDVATVCAGRTDAGVHGVQQVVHFDSSAIRDPRSWMLGVTSALPSSVAVTWCQPVAPEFHARFDAVARRYRYQIVNRAVRAAYLHDYLSWERRPLDAERMNAAAQLLMGRQDFSAFRSSQCQAKNPERDVHFIEVRRDREYVIVDVQANAFLHHMVRNIVGSLLMVGAGEKEPKWMKEVLESRDRNIAGPTAAPNGLTFIGPLYDARWALPLSVTMTGERAHGFDFA